MLGVLWWQCVLYKPVATKIPHSPDNLYCVCVMAVLNVSLPQFFDITHILSFFFSAYSPIDRAHTVAAARKRTCNNIFVNEFIIYCQLFQVPLVCF